MADRRGGVQLCRGRPHCPPPAVTNAPGAPRPRQRLALAPFGFRPSYQVRRGASLLL